MTITQYDLDNYIATLRDVNQTAADKIIAYIDKYGLSDTKQLLDYSYSIVATYAEASGAWAAEMYDAIALLEGKYLPPAEIADIATYGDVAKAINGTLKVSENAEEIASAATRWVKMASADTMLNNAIRDGAQFAWVPHGDTCPFCLTLASRGWQNASKKALKGGHAEHIHSNCDCQYTIRFDKNTNVEGYDPDKYLSMYRNAEGSTPQERINSMRREQHQRETVAARNTQLLLEAESPFRNPSTPLTIASYDQSKHIVGGEKYNQYMSNHEYPPSYLTIDEEEIQNLIDKYHGYGILELNRNGEIIPVEKIVDNEKVIGYAVNNLTGEEVPTSGFKIHYSNEGTHIVPMYQNQTNYWKERRAQNGNDWLLRQKS